MPRTKYVNNMCLFSKILNDVPGIKGCIFAHDSIICSIYESSEDRPGKYWRSLLVLRLMFYERVVFETF